MRPVRSALFALALLMPWVARAENPVIAPFRVVTADLRPFSVENQASAPGMLVELVEGISARLDRPIKVEFYPWARSFALVQAEPRIAIIPFTRTTERDAHYQWLIRLYQQQYVFITKTGSPPITSIDAARKVKRIAVLRGSTTMPIALNAHFPPSSFFQDASVEAGLKDLDAGIVDTYYGGEAICAETIRTTGRKLSDYHVGVALGGGDIWLAASGGFSEGEIAALRQAFDAAVKDGTYAQLLKKYKVPE